MVSVYLDAWCEILVVHHGTDYLPYFVSISEKPLDMSVTIKNHQIDIKQSGHKFNI